MNTEGSERIENRGLRLGRGCELGGEKIRAFRVEKGWTQAQLALIAGRIVEKEYGMSGQTISEIERGVRNSPKEETLYGIFEALELSYVDRRSIYENFGYTVEIPLPTQKEIEIVRTAFHIHMSELSYPAYVLDSGLRFHAWNNVLPRVLNISPDTLDKFRGSSIGNVLFGKELDLMSRVVNRSEFLEMLRRAFPHALGPFKKQEWADDVVSKITMLGGEGFLVEDDSEMIGRPMSEFHFQNSMGDVLKFITIRESFTRDDRFWVVYLYPVDDLTRSHLA